MVCTYIRLWFITLLGVAWWILILQIRIVGRICQPYQIRKSLIWHEFNFLRTKATLLYDIHLPFMHSAFIEHTMYYQQRMNFWSFLMSKVINWFIGSIRVQNNLAYFAHLHILDYLYYTTAASCKAFPSCKIGDNSKGWVYFWLQQRNQYYYHCVVWQLKAVEAYKLLSEISQSIVICKLGRWNDNKGDNE